MNLNKIVYLSEQQKNTLFANGSVTVDGETVTYNQNDLYITPEADFKPIVYKNTITLTYNGWSGSGPWSQAVEIDGATINANTKVDLQPNATALVKLIEDGVQALFISNDSGDLTAYAIGAKPNGESASDNITMQVTYYDTM